MTKSVQTHDHDKHNIDFIPKILLKGYTIQRYTKILCFQWNHISRSQKNDSLHCKIYKKKFHHLAMQAKITKLLGKISCYKIKNPLAGMFGIKNIELHNSSK